MSVHAYTSVTKEQFLNLLKWMQDNKDQVERNVSKVDQDGSKALLKTIQNRDWSTTLLVGYYRSDSKGGWDYECFPTSAERSSFPKSRISNTNNILKYASRRTKLKKGYVAHLDHISEETDLYRFIWKKDETVDLDESNSSLQIYDTANKAYDEFILQHVTAKEYAPTTFVQYSIMASLEVLKSVAYSRKIAINQILSQERDTESPSSLDRAIEEPPKVIVYHQGIRATKHLRLRYQTQRIQERIKDRPITITAELLPHIDFFPYEVPAAMSGVLVENRAILLSWFTYRLTRPYLQAGNPKTNDDDITLLGNNQPAVIVTSENEKFDSLASQFKSYSDQLVGEPDDLFLTRKKKPKRKNRK